MSKIAEALANELRDCGSGRNAGLVILAALETDLFDAADLLTLRQRLGATEANYRNLPVQAAERTFECFVRELWRRPDLACSVTTFPAGDGRATPLGVCPSNELNRRDRGWEMGQAAARSRGAVGNRNS